MRLKEVDTLNFLTKKQIRTDKIHIILYIRIDMTSLQSLLNPSYLSNDPLEVPDTFRSPP